MVLTGSCGLRIDSKSLSCHRYEAWHGTYLPPCVPQHAWPSLERLYLLRYLDRRDYGIRSAMDLFTYLWLSLPHCPPDTG